MNRPNPKKSFKQDLADHRSQEGNFSIEETAKLAHTWFLENGGKYFINSEDQLVLAFRGKLNLVGGTQNTNPDYFAMMYDITGYINNKKEGKQFFEYLQNIARLSAQMTKTSTWGYSDPIKCIAYFNLNDDKDRIIRMSVEGTEPVQNGNKTDNLFLIPSPKMSEIKYSSVDAVKTMKALHEILSNSLATDPNSQALIFGWLLTLPLLDCCKPRPILRFEGDSQSGKTTASSLLSTLIYNESLEGCETVAASWQKAPKYPLLILDNLENDNMTQERIDFLLLACNGNSRVKMRQGTDSEIHQARPHCLILCNGIEPFPSAKEELLNRSLVVKFDEKFQSDNFMEYKAIRDIREKRNFFFSALFNLTLKVLKDIQTGEWEEVLQQYREKGILSGKERLRQYLGLGQLYCRNIDAALERLFIEGLEDQTEAAELIPLGHPIVGAIDALFSAFDNASKPPADINSVINDPVPNDQFIQKYGIRFTDLNHSEEIEKNQLYNSLKKFADYNRLHFPYGSFQQFNARFKAAEKLMLKAGFVFEDTGKKPGNRQLFILRRLNTP